MIIIIIALNPEDLRSSFSISHSQHFAHNTTAERGLGGGQKKIYGLLALVFFKRFL